MIAYFVLLTMLAFAALITLVVLGAYTKLSDDQKGEKQPVTAFTRIMGVIGLVVSVYLSIEVYEYFQSTISLVFAGVYVAFVIMSMRLSTFNPNNYVITGEGALVKNFYTLAGLFALLGLVGIVHLF